MNKKKTIKQKKKYKKNIVEHNLKSKHYVRCKI
jgi:hypothetical protein